MRIYALDDENLQLYLLKESLKEVFPDAEILGFDKGGDILEKTAEQEADVYVLDIRVGAQSGIEIAQSIIKRYPKSNIVFATGYDEYKGMAMDMYASGYITKPVNAQKIKSAFEHLRYPIMNANKRIEARVFGNFALIVDGKLVHFSRKKSQELLAYMICKRGTLVTRKEIGAYVLDEDIYDVNQQKRVYSIINDMINDLKVCDADTIIMRDSNGIAVEPNSINCKYYDYLDGKVSLKEIYQGEFMEQYPWADEIKAGFDEKLNRD